MRLTTQQKNYAYAGLTGLVIVGGIVLYKKLNKPNINKQNKEFDNANMTLPSGGSINIIEVARQLGMDMGTAYSWYDPRSATENDDDVKALLLTVPKPLIPFVRSEYAKLYNRNLQADLQKHLDDYDEIRYLFV
jgi:hypothetical protein